MDSGTLLRDSLARNIRGVTGGSALHGGVAIKMYCANSSKPTTNVWVEDVFVRQSDVTPPDTLRAGVMVVTGRPGGGFLNCGVRNLVVENRGGSLIAIGPADNAPANYSTAVNLTVEQARGLGKGTQPGLPLIVAPYADRLVLRDISGDLSGALGASPGRALEIGVNFNYVSGGLPVTIVAGTVKELVIDGCATDNAALPPTAGIWQFGNIGKASIRRLSTTVASGATPGGIELIQPSTGPGPTYCRFAEVDFANIQSGKEIVSWQTKVGNQIVNSLRFDDLTEAVSVSSAIVAPARFAPTIALSFATGVSSLTLTGMTPSSVFALRCTLLVPTNMTISAGTGSGAFVLGSAGSLIGGPTASITLQWLTAGNRWREVARTA